LGEIVLGEFICVQRRRGDDDAPNAKATLRNLDSAFSDQQELGERVVSLLVDRARLRRFEPFDNVIILAETLSTAKDRIPTALFSFDFLLASRAIVGGVSSDGTVMWSTTSLF